MITCYQFFSWKLHTLFDESDSKVLTGSTTGSGAYWTDPYPVTVALKSRIGNRQKSPVTQE
jgi:hypothetical protein